MVYIVYAIINPSSGKRYIGMTYDYKYRKSSHINLLQSGNHYNNALQEDFNKGIKFKWEILYKYYGSNNIEARIMEAYKISQYKDCYNVNRCISTSKLLCPSERIRKPQIKKPKRIPFTMKSAREFIRNY